jgi:hypothetical protein
MTSPGETEADRILRQRMQRAADQERHEAFEAERQARELQERQQADEARRAREAADEVPVIMSLLDQCGYPEDITVPVPFVLVNERTVPGSRRKKIQPHIEYDIERQFHIAGWELKRTSVYHEWHDGSDSPYSPSIPPHTMEYTTYLLSDGTIVRLEKKIAGGIEGTTSAWRYPQDPIRPGPYLEELRALRLDLEKRLQARSQNE